MELICTNCFTHPLAAHREGSLVAVELLVCDLGAIALPEGRSKQAALRCSYCGSTVHLDRHHVAWYDAPGAAAPQQRKEQR